VLCPSAFPKLVAPSALTQLSLEHVPLNLARLLASSSSSSPPPPPFLIIYVPLKSSKVRVVLDCSASANLTAPLFPTRFPVQKKKSINMVASSCLSIFSVLLHTPRRGMTNAPLNSNEVRVVFRSNAPPSLLAPSSPIRSTVENSQRKEGGRNPFME